MNGLSSSPLLRHALLGFLVALSPVVMAAQTVPDGALFVASSRGTVYYWVECPAWRSLTVANLIFFETRAEVVDAGYRPSASAGCAGPSDDTPSTNRSLVSRVVDVGPGLCTVTEVPAADRSHYIVFDAGHWTGGRCLEAVRSIVGASPIDLFIISHSDSDHLGDADDILDEFSVGMVVTTGFERTTASWRAMRDALLARELAGTQVQRLSERALTPGETHTVGDATVTMIAGWDRWNLTRGLSSSERRNVISIVIRIAYAGSSILYTGDTVGRRIGDPDSACKDAEKEMVARHEAGVVSLDSDVMVAAHHGADNGNSTCFIEAVSPSAVVFSAGHDHEHPRAAAAKRFLDAGVSASSLFRTDRGDDEGGAPHWEPAGTINGCKDPRDDDDIEIRISASGQASVAYLTAVSACP